MTWWLYGPPKTTIIIYIMLYQLTNKLQTWYLKSKSHWAIHCSSVKPSNMVTFGRNKKKHCTSSRVRLLLEPSASISRLKCHLLAPKKKPILCLYCLSWASGLIFANINVNALQWCPTIHCGMLLKDLLNANKIFKLSHQLIILFKIVFFQLSRQMTAETWSLAGKK